MKIVIQKVNEENLLIFDWMINIKLLNKNLTEVAICKTVKMYLH